MLKHQHVITISQAAGMPRRHMGQPRTALRTLQMLPRARGGRRMTQHVTKSLTLPSASQAERMSSQVRRCCHPGLLRIRMPSLCSMQVAVVCIQVCACCCLFAGLISAAGILSARRLLLLQMKPKTRRPLWSAR